MNEFNGGYVLLVCAAACFFNERTVCLSILIVLIVSTWEWYLKLFN